MDSDFILINRMRRGDEKALDYFVRKYYEDMLRYCIYHSFCMEDAKDLTQEVFLCFFSTFPNYRHKGKVKNYLYTIARNLCINHYKKNENFAGNMPEADATAPFLDDFTTDVEMRICLDRLPKELREVIILYYYQGMKQSEIADILGIGIPLVKYRLRKAKEQMKSMINPEELHGLRKQTKTKPHTSKGGRG